jgi:hypothetical protein
MLKKLCLLQERNMRVNTRQTCLVNYLCKKEENVSSPTEGARELREKSGASVAELTLPATSAQ